MTWWQVVLFVVVIASFGELLTISNHLQEISRQLRNLHEDMKLEFYKLDDTIQNVGVRLGMDLQDLRPPSSDWDDLPPA